MAKIAKSWDHHEPKDLNWRKSRAFVFGVTLPGQPEKKQGFSWHESYVLPINIHSDLEEPSNKKTSKPMCNETKFPIVTTVENI